MTVLQLIELLKTFDQNLEIITTRYSDYKKIITDDIELIEVSARDSNNEWLGRVHNWQYIGQFPSKLGGKDVYEVLKSQEKIKTYLHIKGN